MKLFLFRLLLTCLGITGLQAEESKQSPGTSVFGAQRYIEYIQGNLPLVIAAPHGGKERPESIPDRIQGVKSADMNTQELARAIVAEIQDLTGKTPHLIVCRLHRVKLDPNREIIEAAQGNPIAEAAWREHHGFISEACQSAVKDYGQAFLIDLHGHSHPIHRLELGYLHSVEDLQSEPELLNSTTMMARGSLAALAGQSPLSYTELLRGPQSLGAFLEKQGLASTPSPGIPVPTEPFFKGGYTIATHCRAEFKTNGLQIEAPRPRIRDTAENRSAFARGLCQALDAFFKQHLQLGLDGKPTSPAEIKR